MNRSTAVVLVAACAVAGGAIAAVVACLPDLPSDAAVLGPVCGDGIIDLDAETCDPGHPVPEAGVPGCGANCQIQCPSGRAPWHENNHCYQRLTSVAHQLGQAIGQCNGRGHVVTFASEAEFQQVFPLLDARPFWVGLETTPSGRYTSVPIPFEPEPGWSPGCPGCYAHTSTPEAALPIDDAEAEGGSNDCVTAVLDPDQPWQQDPCMGLPNHYFDIVCEIEPVGRRSSTCEAGTEICIDLVKTHGAKTYVYHGNSATADAAKQACAALGGRLVVLQSSDEREQLWHELSRLTVPPPSSVWIGLSQVSAGSRRGPATWVWDDSTPADGPDAYPSEWGALQPLQPSTGQSATLSTRAFLLQQGPAGGVDDTLARNDQPDTARPFVCEITADTLAASRDAGPDQ